MKKNKTYTCLILLCFFFAISITDFKSTLGLDSNGKENIKFNSLTPHLPIEIMHDDNFTDYGFLGNGSISNPFLIDSLSIITNESISISIYDTTKYFSILNCFISSNMIGIEIHNISPHSATIAHNKIEGINGPHMTYGIMITDSDYISLVNNSFYDIGSIYTSYDIWLGNCEYTEINKNLLNGDAVEIHRVSIRTEYSAHTVLSENVFEHQNMGIKIESSSNTTINNNYFDDMDQGIYITYSPNNLIYLNTIDNCVYDGISLFASISNVTNNVINGGGISIFSLSVPHAAHRDYTMQNNTVNGKEYGYFVDRSDLILTSDDFSQILLYNCSNTIIRNQLMKDVVRGIFVVDSYNITISNNRFDDIKFHNLYITGCSLLNLEENLFQDSDTQVVFYNTNNATFVNNTFISGLDGIILYNSHYSLIHHNHFQNLYYGVVLNNPCSYNLVHHNNFQDCTGIDDGINNTWYDISTNEGNFWSDWSGIGNYTIEGIANSTDLYPLGAPVIVIIEFKNNRSILLIVTVIPAIFLIVIRRRRRS
ncbi:MAG: right-handed parallel beta-helix repeat-containing protein [Candidatus Heimdallarchaeaceae archaeon]